MTTDEENELVRRYETLIPQQERTIWSARGVEVFAWARDNGAGWLWQYVNRRLESAADASATDALASSSLRTVLDAVRHGLFVVSGGLRLIHANTAMSALLEARTPFASAAGLLVPVAGNARPVLARLQALMGGDGTAATTLHVRLDPGRGDPLGARRFFLRADRLRSATPGGAEGALPVALVQLWSEGGSRGPDEAALRAWFDLTPAEARLASAFAGGSTLAAYAGSEGLSLNTVRTQFAQLRRKMDARDQADVLRILLQLSGI